MNYGQVSDTMQLKKPLHRKTPIPDWAGDTVEFRKRTLGKQAIIRFRVAELCWRKGWSTQEAADEVGITYNAAAHILGRLQRAEGFELDLNG